jgi:hypothetical protein
MTIESIAAAMPASAPMQLSAGAGASLANAAAFEGALANAQNGGQNGGQNGASLAAPAGDRLGPAMRSMLSSLEQVNREAKSVASYAEAATRDGRDMTPGEIIQLTMRCQEFMFHCQLSSNVANRTSEGLQQLFRQQS